MGAIDDLIKIFEFNPDPWKFLNSPLFLLIILIVGICIVVAMLIMKRRIMRKLHGDKPERKIRFRRKSEPSEEQKIQQEPESEPIPPAPQPEPIVIKQKEMQKPIVIQERIIQEKGTMEPLLRERIGLNECLIVQQTADFITVLYNKEGLPQVRRIPLGQEQQQLPVTQEETKQKPFDLTSIRHKAEYIPYEPQTVSQYIQQSKKEDTHQEIVDEVDCILIDDKKKRNFLNSESIPVVRRDSMKSRLMEKKQVPDTTEQQQASQTNNTIIEQEPVDKPPLTEEEVFSDESVEKKEQEKKEEKQPEPPKQDAKKQEPVKPQEQKPTVVEGESKRQTVFKLLEQGKTKDEIYDATGISEKLIERYRTDWIDDQISKLRGLILDGRLPKIKKIMKILDSKEAVLIENGKLYYPGRDKLTYVFLGTTIVCIAIIILLALT